MTQVDTRLESFPTNEDTARRRQVIASLLGAQSFERINWAALLRDGAVIKLRIGHRGVTARLTLSDLGIQVDDERARTQVERWMLLGTKRLLPLAYIQAFQKIEGQARYALRTRAFKTELGLFVPFTAYERWRELAMGLQQQYFQLRDQVIENYASIVQQVSTEYEAIARNNYERLCQTHPDLVTEARDQFVARYCNNIVNLIPSIDRLRSAFVFSFYPVSGHAQLGSAEVEVASGEQPAEVAPLDESASTIDDVRAEVADRERQRALLTNDIRAHAQERFNATLDSFLSSIVGQLRSLTYQATCDVLATMQGRGGSLSPRSVLQLRNLLEQIQALNFYQDDDIERMMHEIRHIVDMRPEQRQHSMADIQRTLRAIATVTRSTLLDLQDAPTSAREIDIPEYPTESTVQMARAELGLHFDPAQFASLSNFRAEMRVIRAESAELGMVPLFGRGERAEPYPQAREL